MSASRSSKVAFFFLAITFPLRAEDSSETESEQSSNTAPILRVELQDGRVLSGCVGPEATTSRLSLVLSTPRIQTVVTLPARKIKGVRVNDKELTLEEFRRRLNEFRLKQKPELERQGAAQSKAQSSRVRPQFISINTRLANWDRDSEPDGLLLSLQVFGRDALPIARTGNLNVELVGLRPWYWWDGKRPGRGRGVSTLKRWSVRIRTSEFKRGVAVVKLPFQELAPDTLTDFSPAVLLTASYSIAGSGVFQASESDVLIRRTGWTRDDLQQLSGRRQLKLAE